MSNEIKDLKSSLLLKSNEISKKDDEINNLKDRFKVIQEKDVQINKKQDKIRQLEGTILKFQKVR